MVRVDSRLGKVVAVLFVTGVAIVVVLVTRGGGQAREFRDLFHRHRSDFERVAEMVATRELVAPDGESWYYGPLLPPELHYLSATDKVSIWNDGSIFVPRWTGIPDDAGGYWHRSRSPGRLDMYGMWCTDPVALGDDWWACGVE